MYSAHAALELETFPIANLAKKLPTTRLFEGFLPGTKRQHKPY